MVPATIAVTVFIISLRMRHVLTQIPEDRECDITKRCSYFLCTLYSSDCLAMVSWVNSGDSVLFTLKGLSDPPNLWFALGFSDDHYMGNDSVTGCKYSNGKTKVFNAMNNIHSAPTILNNEGVSLVSSSLRGSMFECTFKRLKAAGKRIARFDLYNKYYFLFARGQLNKRGALIYHGPDYAASSDLKYWPQYQPSVSEEPLVTANEKTSPGRPTPVATKSNIAIPPAAPPHAAPPYAAPPPAAPPPAAPPPAARTSTAPTPGPAERLTTFQLKGSYSVPRVDACGRSVGCFSDCRGIICSFIVTWDVQDENVVYTITTNITKTANRWAAIAFSSDHVMEDDDVMGCVTDTQGNVLSFAGWTLRHKTPVIYNDIEIKLIGHKSEDGLLSCTFVRPIAAGVYRVDVNQAWTMFFAKGRATFTTSQGAMPSFSIHYHERDRFISPVPVKASDHVDVRKNNYSTKYNPLVKAHGSLMISAWVGFASVGIILARYYKKMWTKVIFSQSSWLQIHRACMTLAFCLTASGIVTIFIEVGGYSKIFGVRTFLKAHPIIGIIVMSLAFINPIMGLFRPKPGTPKRPIFNWAHRFVGTSALILAAVNICFGLLLTKSDAPFYLICIMGGFIGWMVFVLALLESIQFFGRRLGYIEVHGTPDMQSTTEGAENSTIILAKQIILTVHCIVVASFATVLVVLFVQGSKEKDED